MKSQDFIRKWCGLEGNPGKAAIRPACNRKHLAADFPYISPAPLAHIGSSRQRGAEAVELFVVHATGWNRIGKAAAPVPITVIKQEKRLRCSWRRDGGVQNWLNLPVFLFRLPIDCLCVQHIAMLLACIWVAYLPTVFVLRSGGTDLLQTLCRCRQ